MNTYYCTQCKQTVDLNDEAEQVFTDNNLREGEVLAQCPYCITETLSTVIPTEHMRMTGPSRRWGMCGYHSTTSKRVVTVERRVRE